MAPGGLSLLPAAVDLCGRLSVGPDVRQPPPRARDANLSRRDHAACAAARWVCVLHPCAATASRSRLTTPREAPSDGPAWAHYESGKSARG